MSTAEKYRDSLGNVPKPFLINCDRVEMANWGSVHEIFWVYGGVYSGFHG